MAARRITLLGIAVVILILGIASHSSRPGSKQPALEHLAISNTNHNRLPSLNAQGVTGVREITKAELLSLLSKSRSLTNDEKAQIDRGCPGLVCLYQELGLKRWPEEAQSARAFVRLEDALRRECSGDQTNFVFVKQAWWTTGNPPPPDPKTGEVPLSSVTRSKPGWYTFNYAAYFPATATYAWINHREFGFPLNLVRPETVYLSLSPPPLDANRPAQIYCSTCR